VLSVVGIGDAVKLDLTPLWLKGQTVRGVYAYGEVTHEKRRKHLYEVAVELVDTGRVDVKQMVTHSFALADYRKAIEVNLEKERNRAMKTLLVPR
jgi:threonine dehydrogenase-like Zn-dependent dehydrogenase